MVMQSSQFGGAVQAIYTGTATSMYNAQSQVCGTARHYRWPKALARSLLVWCWLGVPSYHFCIAVAAALVTSGYSKADPSESVPAALALPGAAASKPSHEELKVARCKSDKVADVLMTPNSNAGV